MVANTSLPCLISHQNFGAEKCGAETDADTGDMETSKGRVRRGRSIKLTAPKNQPQELHYSRSKGKLAAALSSSFSGYLPPDRFYFASAAGSILPSPPRLGVGSQELPPAPACAAFGAAGKRPDDFFLLCTAPARMQHASAKLHCLQAPDGLVRGKPCDLTDDGGKAVVAALESSAHHRKRPHSWTLGGGESSMRSQVSHQGASTLRSTSTNWGIERIVQPTEISQ